jgi:hypothetical protein
MLSRFRCNRFDPSSFTYKVSAEVKLSIHVIHCPIWVYSWPKLLQRNIHILHDTCNNRLPPQLVYKICAIKKNWHCTTYISQTEIKCLIHSHKIQDFTSNRTQYTLLTQLWTWGIWFSSGWYHCVISYTLTQELKIHPFTSYTVGCK